MTNVKSKKRKKDRKKEKKQLRAHKLVSCFKWYKRISCFRTKQITELSTTIPKAWFIVVRISSPEPAIWLLLLLFVVEVN